MASRGIEATTFTSKDALPDQGGYDVTKLKGKSVIVTGGGSGIGEAVVRAMVAAGAFVTIGEFNPERSEQLVTELGQDKVASVKCDVRIWQDQVGLFKTALEKSPSKGIDVVFANAGISGADDVFRPTEGPDGEPVEPDLSVTTTNLIGVLYTVKLALHYFPRQPEGEGRDRCLVITSSLAGFIDHPGAPQYQAAKFAVRGLMRSIRRTGPAQGIRINIIAPTFIATRILSPAMRDRIAAAGLEFASVEDAAESVLHLAADHRINGRAVGVVARNEHPRGYMDLKSDDIDEDPMLKEWSKLSTQSRTRVAGGGK